MSVKTTRHLVGALRKGLELSSDDTHRRTVEHRTWIYAAYRSVIASLDGWSESHSADTAMRQSYSD